MAGKRVPGFLHLAEPKPICHPRVAADTFCHGNRSLYFTDMKEIQRLLSISLDKTWKNCMTHDWIRSEKAKSFPLHEYYVKLRWSKMVKRAMKDQFEELDSIYDILDPAEDTLKVILVEGIF